MRNYKDNEINEDEIGTTGTFTNGGKYFFTSLELHGNSEIICTFKAKKKLIAQNNTGIISTFIQIKTKKHKKKKQNIKYISDK